MRSKLTTGMILCWLCAATPVLAHHSFAMFDFTHVVKLKGTVQELRWTNPHVVLLVDAPAIETGAVTVWTVELTSPGNLKLRGWTRHSLKPGDRIELELNPLRDGRHGGAFKKATLLDTGQVLVSDYRATERPGLK